MKLSEMFNTQKIVKKLSKFHLETFDPEVYKKINLDSLLVFGIYSLKKKKIKVTEENIYVQTFLLFPQRYSLPSFIFFPNAARLNKSWLRCRSDKNLITGTSATSFELTKLGLAEAKKIENVLKDSEIDLESRTSDTIPGERAIIEEFMKHKAFLNFQENEEIEMSEREFCMLVKVRQTASATLFETKFAELKLIFKENKNSILLEFLNKLRKNFYYFFKSREDKGSMMSKKKGRGK